VYASNPEEKEAWFKDISDSIDVVRAAYPSLNSEIIAAPLLETNENILECSTCSAKFSVTFRRHHCRQCGKIFCGPCTNQKKYIPGQGQKRVCVDCLNQKINLHTKREHKPVEFVEYNAICRIDWSEDTDQPTLNIKRGDKIGILKRDESGWWLGLLGDNVGWIPSSSVEKKKSRDTGNFERSQSEKRKQGRKDQASPELSKTASRRQKEKKEKKDH